MCVIQIYSRVKKILTRFADDIIPMPVVNRSRIRQIAVEAAAEIKEQVDKNRVEDENRKKTTATTTSTSSSSSSSKSIAPSTSTEQDRDEIEEQTFEENADEEALTQSGLFLDDNENDNEDDNLYLKQFTNDSDDTVDYNTDDSDIFADLDFN